MKSPKRAITLLLATSLLLAGVQSAYAQSPIPPATATTQQKSAPDSLKTTLSPPDSLKTAADSLTVPLANQDSLFYAADSIAYHYDTEQINLYGNTSVRYHTSTILADSLQIDLKKDRAFSLGRTIMQDADQVLIGKQVYYDVNSQTGMMEDGASKVEKGFYYGDEMRRVDNDVYDIDGGRYTTCDDPTPDFYFWSKQMRMYRNDKIVGRPVVFYVNHIPIFYFPFVTFSIKRGRTAGFLIPEPGYNTVDGKFVRNIAYFFPYKDYADATVALDLMERTGWQLNLETRYVQRYLLNGDFYSSFRKHITPTITTNDYSVRGNHHQELGNNATFDVNLDYVSNKRIWQNSNEIDQSMAQRVTSSMSYRRPVLSSYMDLGASYTQDLINNTASLLLPSGSFSLPTRPVYELFTSKDSTAPRTAWWTNFNYNYYVRLDHTGELRSPERHIGDLIWANTTDSLGRPLDEHHFGMKHSLGVNYNYKMLGWLNLTQGLYYNEAWMDRDMNGKKWVRGDDYSAATSANFVLYGMKKFNNFYVSAVRHIITPSAGFSWNPGFPQNDKYYYFGGVGLNSGSRSRSVSMSLNQTWQVKLAPKGELKERKINDFLGWSARTYLNLESKEHQWADISHSFTLHPAQYDNHKVNVSYSASYNFSQKPYELHLLDWKFRNQYVSHSVTVSGKAPYTDYFPRNKNESFNAYLPKQDSTGTFEANPSSLKSDESWNLTLAQDFNAGRDILHPTNNNLRFSATAKVTTNWNLTYSNYISIKTGQMLSQNYDISRNLHCWKLTVSYTRRPGYWDYRIVFFNIALPDALKLQTHDNKRF